MAEKKFVIFGQGRSGSNLLRTLLNSHPDIFCENEIFNPNRIAKSNYFKRLHIRWFPLSYIFSLLKKSDKKVYGFKIFDFHHHSIQRIINNLEKKGWKIIHIQRRNTLKQAFSGIIANYTNIWIKKKHDGLPSEVYHIPPEEAKTAIETRKNRFEQELEILGEKPHLHVIYEDHLQSKNLWQETANKVFDFLEIKSHPVIAKTEITDPRPDRERIENFEEIIEFLKANGHAKAVEDYYKYL